MHYYPLNSAGSTWGSTLIPGRSRGLSSGTVGLNLLQGPCHKTFEHLQADQKQHRRKVEASEGWKEASDRTERRIGQLVDDLGDRVVVWHLQPGHDDGREYNERVEIDEVE
jgi:hypothetical protein